MQPTNQGFNLPPPVDPSANQAPLASEASQQPAEYAQIPVEQSLAPQAAAMPQFAMPAPATSPAAQQVPAVTTSALTVTPSVSDDQDLIEKDWVIKAKQIVEANREDPYKQSEELTVFKADYMQKRYNKSIKVSK